MKQMWTLFAFGCYSFVFAASPDIDQIISELDAAYGHIETFSAKAEVYQYSG